VEYLAIQLPRVSELAHDLTDFANASTAGTLATQVLPACLGCATRVAPHGFWLYDSVNWFHRRAFTSLFVWRGARGGSHGFCAACATTQPCLDAIRVSTWRARTSLCCVVSRDCCHSPLRCYAVVSCLWSVLRLFRLIALRAPACSLCQTAALSRFQQVVAKHPEVQAPFWTAFCQSQMIDFYHQNRSSAGVGAQIEEVRKSLALRSTSMAASSLVVGGGGARGRGTGTDDAARHRGGGGGGGGGGPTAGQGHEHEHVPETSPVSSRGTGSPPSPRRGEYHSMPSSSPVDFQSPPAVAARATEEKEAEGGSAPPRHRGGGGAGGGGGGGGTNGGGTNGGGASSGGPRTRAWVSARRRRSSHSHSHSHEEPSPSPPSPRARQLAAREATLDTVRRHQREVPGALPASIMTHTSTTAPTAAATAAAAVHDTPPTASPPGGPSRLVVDHRIRSVAGRSRVSPTTHTSPGLARRSVSYHHLSSSARRRRPVITFATGAGGATVRRVPAGGNSGVDSQHVGTPTPPAKQAHEARQTVVTEAQSPPQAQQSQQQQQHQLSRRRSRISMLPSPQPTSQPGAPSGGDGRGRPSDGTPRGAHVLRTPPAAVHTGRGPSSASSAGGTTSSVVTPSPVALPSGASPAPATPATPSSTTPSSSSASTGMPPRSRRGSLKRRIASASSVSHTPTTHSRGFASPGADASSAPASSPSPVVVGVSPVSQPREQVGAPAAGDVATVQVGGDRYTFTVTTPGSAGASGRPRRTRSSHSMGDRSAARRPRVRRRSEQAASHRAASPVLVDAKMWQKAYVWRSRVIVFCCGLFACLFVCLSVCLSV